MEEILDRSGSYLKIFTKAVTVDKNLLKWEIQKKEIQKSKGLDLLPEGVEDGDFNNMDLSEFLNLDRAGFNIYLGKRIASDMGKMSVFSFIDDSHTATGKENDKETFGEIIIRKFRKFFNSNNQVEEEEVFEFDIFKFFEQVKLTSKESKSQYSLRIEPYMIALKQAKDMGQQALIDELTAEIFNNKFESILFSEGFHNKITEEQLVHFIKVSEKGVRLSYISNFTRPVPQEIIDIKKKADQLLVFDNYCVLYYDPELKSYKQTIEEKEAERRKKADPILFGMISGSRNLYYVADWIDEYCDLTLDEFIKVSGIDKRSLEITEKIML